MIAFIEKLNSEVLRSIERIESRDTDVLKKSLEASRVLGEAFDRLNNISSATVFKTMTRR